MNFGFCWCRTFSFDLPELQYTHNLQTGVFFILRLKNGQRCLLQRETANKGIENVVDVFINFSINKACIKRTYKRCSFFSSAFLGGRVIHISMCTAERYWLNTYSFKKKKSYLEVSIMDFLKVAPLLQAYVNLLNLFLKHWINVYR